ncbi:MAG: 16S rRNA (guanine(527)-N(7))-methyltransferase RsmG [Hyphomicrobiaceae bacterium]
MNLVEFACTFDVSRETVGRLEMYADLLRRWQKTINIVAPKSLDDVWHRHFADSAQLFAFIPAEARHLIDLGSGGGFPGLVLAILAMEKRPPNAGSGALHVTLVESDTRKAAFLRDVARQTGIAVDIMSTRIESITNSANVASVDVITSRALAPLPRLFELVERMFEPQTVALFLKGKSVHEEVEAARRHWEFGLDLEESITDTDARIAVIRHLKRKEGGLIP